MTTSLGSDSLGSDSPRRDTAGQDPHERDGVPAAGEAGVTEAGAAEGPHERSGDTKAADQTDACAGEGPKAPGTEDRAERAPAATRVRRWRRPRTADLVAMAIPAVVLAVMGWRQRWITDDGLIFTRAVRQILAGNGPVYSVGERAETSTSTLWQWLLALAGQVTPFDLAPLAVHLGLLLSVGGLWFALDGTRRVQRGLGVRRLLLPAGALVFVAVPSIWDFATAGMETGLIIFWIGVSWWLLAGVWLAAQGGGAGRRRLLAVSVWFGLGPLVRPDLGLSMLVLLAAAAVLARTRWPRALAMLVAAGALPAAYEIFRMGYYGVIFPLPALTKEAGESLWGRGFDYLLDYLDPYFLWIPLALLAVAAVLLLRRHRPERDTWVVAGAPAVAALGQTFYILKVGGDFMHGRMWLPVLLLLMLPVLLVPADRWLTPVVALVAVWALGVGTFVRTEVITTPTTVPGASAQVWNERDIYTNWTGTNNPTTQAAHARTLPGLRAEVPGVVAEGRRVLLFDPNYMRELPPLPLRADLDFPVGVTIGRLGVGGVVVPLDGIVVDVWGLSNTVGAHIETTNHAAAGHGKLLPLAWNIALYVDPSGDALVPPSAASQEQIRAARAALACGDLKELVDSVTEPMSWSRFWKNLTGSLSRTSLRIPPDPILAEAKFCGTGR